MAFVYLAQFMVKCTISLVTFLSYNNPFTCSHLSCVAPCVFDIKCGKSCSVPFLIYVNFSFLYVPDFRVAQRISVFVSSPFPWIFTYIHHLWSPFLFLLNQFFELNPSIWQTRVRCLWVILCTVDPAMKGISPLKYILFSPIGPFKDWRFKKLVVSAFPEVGLNLCQLWW